ncbi:MAG: sulfotransferase [Myxococcota bacterium]
MQEPKPQERVEDIAIAEYLVGELERGPLPPLRFALRLTLRMVELAVLVGPSVGLWLVYGLGTLAWGRAPNVVRLSQVTRYLRYTWTLRSPEVELPLHHRVWLSTAFLRKFEFAPVQGLAWILDEALYGRMLDAVEVRSPLIELSATRSGSTQLARYLEHDPRLLSPSVLQLFAPYLWLWRLAARFAPLVSLEAIDARLEATMPPEFLERHEADAFRTDTFEVALSTGCLNLWSLFLGPRVAQREFNFGEAAPENRDLWDRDFVMLFDRIARKTLLRHGASEDQRIFIKGHFLAAADLLERRYPDARFVTMVRHPSKRLQSAVNYLRVHPVDAVLGPPPWRTVGRMLVPVDARYCELEQAWYGRRGGARRCVLRFDDYCTNLEGTMAKVYRECLDIDALPSFVPREHEPRKRKDYLVNRSLEDVGVDRHRLEARLSDYIEWCAPRHERA